MDNNTIWGHDALELDTMAMFPAIVVGALVVEGACNCSNCSVNECKSIADAMSMLIMTCYHTSITPQFGCEQLLFIPVENFLGSMVDLVHHLVYDL